MTIYPRRRAFDFRCARYLPVEIGWAYAADNSVCISHVRHCLEAGKSEGLADAPPAVRLRHTHGTEEVSARGLVTAKAKDLSTTGRNKTGDGLVAESHIALARPRRSEGLSSPRIKVSDRV